MELFVTDAADGYFNNLHARMIKMKEAPEKDLQWKKKMLRLENIKKFHS